MKSVENFQSRIILFYSTKQKKEENTLPLE